MKPARPILLAVSLLLVLCSCGESEDAITEARQMGYDAGYQDGKEEWYSKGYADGKQEVTIYCDGDHSDLYEETYNRGYDDGYSDGYDEGVAGDSGKTDYVQDVDQPYEPSVYITEQGTKYHNPGCRYLRKSCYKITLSEAVEAGYTPCSVCFRDEFTEGYLAAVEERKEKDARKTGVPWVDVANGAA